MKEWKGDKEIKRVGRTVFLAVRRKQIEITFSVAVHPDDFEYSTAASVTLMSAAGRAVPHFSSLPRHRLFIHVLL